MWVHRPRCPGNEPIVVEHSEGSDAHLLWITIMAERKVPVGAEPAAPSLEDRVCRTHRTQMRPPFASQTDNRREINGCGNEPSSQDEL